MEGIVEAVIETGVDVIEAGAGSKDRGCLLFSIVLVLIAIGITLYFVYK